MIYLEYLLTAALMFIVDLVWTYWLIYVHKRQAFKSAMCAVFIYLFGTFVTLKWIEDKTFIIPAVIGGFLGTYYTVKWNVGNK